jgi:hypothetical protein
LLPIPFTVTITFPVAAAEGTVTVMLVSLHSVGVPPTPLKVTELLPCVAPKLVPLTTTEVPTVPLVGERAVIDGDD